MVNFGALLLSAAVATALPAPGSTDGNLSLPFSHRTPIPWNEGAVTEFPIHSSCNATQRRQIELGLSDAVTLAEHAKSHILRWGNESDIYRKYFGDNPSINVIGAFDIIVNGDRKHALFRCDNPDGNCAIEGYGGHWRGENATDETVICELSYKTSRYLSSMCAFGYTVSGSETDTFWGSDLLHRLYHLPAIGQGWVDHFADGYEEVIHLASENGTLSTRDSETLQYFALEAYAYDIAVPGTGCPGTQHEHHEASQTLSTPTATDPPSTTSEVPANCHTHDGGELHCT